MRYYDRVKDVRTRMKKGITTTSTLVIIALVVIIVVGVGIAYYLSSQQRSTQAGSVGGTTTSMMTTNAGGITTTTPEGATGGTGGEVTIEMWDGLGGGDGYVMDMLVNEFNNEYAGKIKVVRVMQGAWLDVYNKLLAGYRAGTLPDVVIVHQSEIPLFAYTVAKPVDNFVRKYNISRDQFVPYIWDAMWWPDPQTGEKHMVAIPWDSHPYAMYVNTNLASQYNISIPKPGEIKTPEDLYKWWKYAQSKLPDPYKATACPSWGDWWLWWSFQPRDLVQGKGTPDNPMPELDSNDSVYIFQFWKRLVDEGICALHTWQELAWGLAMNTSNPVLTWIHGPWMQATFDKVPGFNYTVVPIFGGEGNPYRVWGSSHVFMLTYANSPERQRAAEEFVAWMIKPENNGRWGQYAGHIPAEIAAQHYPPYASIPQRQAFVKVAELGFRYVTFNAAIPVIGDRIQAHFAAVLQGQETPEDAAKAVQKEALDILSQYKQQQGK